MPRYYFDLVDGGGFAPDEYGEEFADDDEARAEALALLPRLARDGPPDDHRHEFVARVRDDRGEIVCEASLTLRGRLRPGR